MLDPFFVTTNYKASYELGVSPQTIRKWPLSCKGPDPRHLWKFHPSLAGKAKPTLYQQTCLHI